MPKALCILGMVVSVLLIILFAMDIPMSWPFGGVGVVWSSVFIVGAALLAYLSFATFRQQT